LTPHPQPERGVEISDLVSVPESNNVYGYLMAPKGLRPLLVALRQLFDDELVSIRTSSFDESETLRLSSDVMDFESTPLGGGKHLLNGGVTGSRDQVLPVVQKISHAFAEATIEHQFEIHDFDGTLVQTVPTSSPSVRHPGGW
jgi:hypothetical protein